MKPQNPKGSTIAWLGGTQSLLLPIVCFSGVTFPAVVRNMAVLYMTCVSQ